MLLWIIEEDQVSCGNTLSHDGKKANTTNPGTLCVDFTLHNFTSVFAFASLCAPVFVVSVYGKIYQI